MKFFLQIAAVLGALVVEFTLGRYSSKAETHSAEAQLADQSSEQLRAPIELEPQETKSRHVAAAPSVSRLLKANPKVTAEDLRKVLRSMQQKLHGQHA